MDITVYLPDALALRAKERGVNLSRMLRDAVTAQFDQEDAMETTLKDAAEVRLDLEDGSIGRFTGELIGEDRDSEVYLTDDERVIAYDSSGQRYSVIEDPAHPETGIAAWLSGDAYVEAMQALGLTPVVDI